MARSAVDERIIDLPIELIIGRMRTVGSESNFALRSENPTPTGVWFRVHHGVSFTSWGEKITVTLTPMGQQTKVNIYSECGMPTQIVDYGKNRKVVNYLFDFIMRPGYGQPAPTTPQYQAQQPVQNTQPAQTEQQSAPQKKFCTSCGKPVVSGARFCTNCGNPLQ